MFYGLFLNYLVTQDLLREFCKLFCLRSCVSRDQWKNKVLKRFCKEFERHFCTKIIVVIIPTNLVTSLHRNQKQELNFQQVGDLEVFPFFVYSELKSTLKVCRIQYFFLKGFSYILFLLVLQFYRIPLHFHTLAASHRKCDTQAFVKWRSIILNYQNYHFRTFQNLGKLI